MVAETVAEQPETVAEQQSPGEHQTTKAPVFTEAFQSDQCFYGVSKNPLAPPAGEQRNEKVSEFEQVGGSFHHNSTTEQLFELLEKLKDELLRRIND